MTILKERFAKLPKETQRAVKMFIRAYNEAGYLCYLVGGSCRDLLLDEEPYDFDFAVNCPLDVSKMLFKKTISVGEAQGTLLIIFRGFQFEVTRFRKDVKTDGRRAIVEFSESIEEDQRRRDIRINALAYDALNDVLIDSQNGLNDFKQKVIRFVGNASERIQEDHLRALRYGRLIAKLAPFGFDYIPEERDQVIQSFNSDVLSLERIYDELGKIVRVGAIRKRFLIDYLSKLRIFSKYISDDQLAAKVVAKILNTGNPLNLAYEFHKENGIRETAREMKLSKKDKRLILLLHEYKSQDLGKEEVLKSLLSRVERADVESLIRAFRDVLGVDISGRAWYIFDRGVPYRIGDLKINGDDLKKMGYSGKETGKTLESLLRNVWRDPQINTRGRLLELARNRDHLR